MEKPLSNEEATTFTDIASKLDRLIADSATEVQLQNLLSLEASFNGGLISHDELRQDLDEVNKNWPYRNKGVRVSGQIDVPISEGRLKKFTAEDIDAVSYGFVCIRINDGELEGEVRLCHSLGVRLDNGDIERVFGHTQGVVLDYPHMSPEYAESYLGYFDPELKLDIDNRLSSYDGLNSTKALALTDLEVWVDSSHSDHREVMDSATEYVSSKVDIDPEGYMIIFDRPFYSRVNPNSNESVKVNKIGAYMAKLQSIQFMPTDNNSRPGFTHLKPILNLDIYSQDVDRYAESYSIPLESVAELISHRDYIYGNK